MYTAIFTPYVAAFLLGELEYNQKKTNRYINTDPIVIIDLIGKFFRFRLNTIRTCTCVFDTTDLSIGTNCLLRVLAH